MARVDVDTPAPDFELEDFQGHRFSLAAQAGEHHVLLVLNRGMT